LRGTDWSLQRDASHYTVWSWAEEALPAVTQAEECRSCSCAGLETCAQRYIAKHVLSNEAGNHNVASYCIQVKVELGGWGEATVAQDASGQPPLLTLAPCCCCCCCSSSPPASAAAAATTALFLLILLHSCCCSTADACSLLLLLLLSRCSSSPPADSAAAAAAAHHHCPPEVAALRM
jgi:hypothetical protein